MIGDMFKIRDTLSYGALFLTTDFTDFTRRGFRELRACVRVAGGANMRRIRSALSPTVSLF